MLQVLSRKIKIGFTFLFPCSVFSGYMDLFALRQQGKKELASHQFHTDKKALYIPEKIIQKIASERLLFEKILKRSLEKDSFSTKKF